VKNILGMNLKFYRKKSGLKQTELGQIAFELPSGAAQSKISKFENGVQEPSEEELGQLSMALKIEQEELFSTERLNANTQLDEVREVVIPPKLLAGFPTLRNYVIALNAAADNRDVPLMKEIVKTALSAIEKELIEINNQT